MVKGLGDMVGVGGWERVKESWGGLLKLGLSLSAAAQAVNAFRDLPHLPRGTLADTLGNAGKGLVAWDQWKDDPARAAGNVVFNAGAIVYGPKGVGAAAKGTVTATKTVAAAVTGRVGAAAGDAAEAARLAELDRLIAAQRADAAAEAVGQPGMPSAGDVSLDQGWGKPKAESEPGRIKELDGRPPDDLRENMERGDDFNRVRERDGAYQTGELTLENGKRVDGYTPPEGGRPGEIVSRKDTQLADITPETADKHLQEALNKYPPGSVIADTPANRLSHPELIGKPLSGQTILEVPVQRQPVPPDLAARAKRLGVTIRDYTGTVLNE
jgi:hypothetical protein